LAYVRLRRRRFIGEQSRNVGIRKGEGQDRTEDGAEGICEKGRISAEMSRALHRKCPRMPLFVRGW